MNLNAIYTAIGPGLTSTFIATDGVPPYTYTILHNDAGGSINSATGAYVAPAVCPNKSDTIQCQDSMGTISTLSILVGNPLLLFCDIIKNGLGLDESQVYLYNQKINIPIDSQLYISVGILNNSVFGNSLSYDSNGNAIQKINMKSTLGVDILSRSTEALFRKEEVVMALNSHYSQQQQEHNSFYIARIPSSFVNLSELEASAIPYRFHFDVNIQYSREKLTTADYFDHNFGFVEPIDIQA